MAAAQFKVCHQNFLMKAQCLRNCFGKYFSNRSFHRDVLCVSEDVRSALDIKKPVVALESTIITHGMPYPQNYQTAKSVESIIKSYNVTPATIAVLDGKIHVGLNDHQLNRLSESAKEGAMVKISRRDYPYVLGKRLSGGTTVSGTMQAAHYVGIKLFVTGGIGGVHRDGHNSLDISADLTELGRTPITVVCAGVKSILDIGRTLEYLETQGVCVLSYGHSKEFPAFFTAKSGHNSPHNVTNVREAAQVIASSAGTGSGILLGVPIPEEHAALGGEIENAIQTALNDARSQSISGRDVTPFILSQVNQLTKGASLKANIALIENNAHIGAQIANTLTLIENSEKTQFLENKTQSTHQESDEKSTVRLKSAPANKPVVIGGTNVDFTMQFTKTDIQYGGATNHGTVRISCGGVAHNLADCMARLGTESLLISAVGGDNMSQFVKQQSSHMLDLGLCTLPGQSTACYSVTTKQSGDILHGLGDMDIHVEIKPPLIAQYESSILSSPIVCIDGNLPPESVAYVCKLCDSHNIPVWYEPSDVNHVRKLFANKEVDILSLLTVLSPNVNELQELCRWRFGDDCARSITDCTDKSSLIEEASRLSTLLLDSVQIVFTSLGAHGALWCQKGELHSNQLHHVLHRAGARSTTTTTTATNSSNSTSNGQVISILHYPTLCSQTIIQSVSGGGDCMASGVLSSSLTGDSLDAAMYTGMRAACLSVQSYHAVPNTIDQHVLQFPQSDLDSYSAQIQVIR